MSEKPQVLIVGAGLAGLSCAWNLHQAGVSFQILEASDSVGGRVKTDVVNGFLLDRGFQVLLTAYPEAQEILDYAALSLNKFYPGAMVRLGGRFHRTADPFRQPLDALANIFSPIGTLADKRRIATLRRRVLTGSVNDVFKRPETKTIDALKTEGFSDSIIEAFFRPFLGGIFLDPELQTTSRMFEFVFRMFSLGDTSLPMNGMMAIPDQICARLPKGAVYLNSPVTKVTATSVSVGSGEQIFADAVVLATDGQTAAQLLDVRVPRSQEVACVYFAADKPPVEEPILLLNGDADGPVNNLCVPNLVARKYAPAGASLISATVLRPSRYERARIESLVREHLTSWFGSSVSKWEHLRTYWITGALPEQLSLPGTEEQNSGCVSNGLYVCGDYTGTASLNGAIKSGRLVAQAIVNDLSNLSGELAGKNFHQPHAKKRITE